MKKQISIIGCGWFGLPLAIHLLNQGYKVKGTTTSYKKIEDLKAVGVNPYNLKISETGIKGDIKAVLQDSHVLVLNIPPGLRKDPDKSYVKKIRHVIPFIEKSSITKVILISSTSVFKDEFPYSVISNVTQPNSDTKKGKQLILVEELFRANKLFNTSVLRFSGLIGNGRHPIHYLSGKTGIKNPEAPINLIHIEDCVNITALIIQKNNNDAVFNLSYPYHPTRERYYTNKAKALGLVIPSFDKTTFSVGKIIDSTEVKTKLEYSFNVKI